jgi:UDP-N-acetylmuramoyl-L-alanyl-D-glutamate--2,6-diaminopimelate ligase
MAKGRIAVVFGCGGNRDQEKRPKMASIAEKYSDLSIVTSDNPRNEDPKKIIADVLKETIPKEKVIIEPDRREAIRKAIQWAKPNDLILIAGKGHETKQIFSYQAVDFEDRKVVQELFEE